MIATGLVFVLGALVATLVALLFVPVLWRKAQRLARRDFIATMPASMNEIRAEVDRVRAEAAMTVRRHELLAAQAREAAALARAEIGRLIGAGSETTYRLKELEAQNATMREEIEALTGRLRSRDDMYTEMEGEHRGLRRDMDVRAEEMEALADRLRELDNVADERRVRLVAADTKVEQLSSDLRGARRELLRQSEALESAERTLREALARIALLEGRDPASDPVAFTAAAGTRALASDEPAMEESAPDTAQAFDPEIRAAVDDLRRRSPGGTEQDQAEVRERVAEVAARVVRLTAGANGSQPPRPVLPDASEPGAGMNGSARTANLVERVARGVGEPIRADVEDQPAALTDEPGADVEPLADDPAAAVNAATGKRKRGGARARQRSRR